MGTIVTMTRCLAALLMTLVVCLFAGQAAAQQWDVTSGLDDGSPETLRVQINSASGGDWITLTTDYLGYYVHPVITDSTPMLIGASNLIIAGIANPSNTPLNTITIPGGTARPSPLFSGDENGNGLILQSLIIRDIKADSLGSTVYGSIVSIGSSGGTNNDVTFGSLDNTRFIGNSASWSTELTGGGLVGAYSNAGGAQVGNILRDSAFGGLGANEENTINVSSNLFGGGLVGAASKSGLAKVGSVDGDVSFTRNDVVVCNRLYGGGLLGASSESGSAEVGATDGIAGSYVGNSVETTLHFIGGGGLVGASVWMVTGGDAVVGDIRGDSIFGGAQYADGNVVSSAYNIQGGGLVGAYSSGGSAIVGVVQQDAHFERNRISTVIDLYGGGVIGAVSSSGAAKVGEVAGEFLFNTVDVGGYLAGGGVLGAYTSSVTAGTSTLGNLNKAVFSMNRVTVGENAAAGEGWALGGVIATSGLDSAWTITDTSIINNLLDVRNHNAAVTAGTIYIGTDRISGSGSHQVTVNGETSINGNLITYSDGTTRYNSFHFGRGRNDSTNSEMYDSLADASLTLALGAGQRMAIIDPISVDMNNGKKFDYKIAGEGTVWLGGVNRLDAAGGSTFTATSGTLVLMDNFSLTKESAALDGSTNNGRLDVTLDNSSGVLNLVFQLENRDSTLAMFADPDSFVVTGNPEVRGIGVSVSENTFSPDAVADKWLVTDKRGVVEETNFNNTNPNADIRFITEGDSLYIAGTAGSAPDSVRYNQNPNVRSSFLTSSLNQVWQEVKKELSLSPSDEDALFSRIAANPELLTAEAFASRAIAALDTAGAMWSGVRGFAGLDVPGGWQRDADGSPAVQSQTATASVACPSSRGLGIWAGAFGSRADQRSQDGLSGYDSHLYGGGIGGTYVFNQVWRGGLYFAYGRDKTEFDNLGAKITADAYQAGGFAEARLTSRWGMRVDMSHTWFDNELEHSTQVGNYSADFDQRAFALGLESGYDFRPGDGCTSLTPFAGLRWQHLSQDSASERASAGAANAFASQLDSLSADSVVSSLGLELSRDIRLSQGRRLTPSLRAAWNHEFGDTTVNGNASYSGISGNYRLSSIAKTRDKAGFGARLTARVRESASGSIDLMAGVDATVGRRYSDYGFKLGVRVDF